VDGGFFVEGNIGGDCRVGEWRWFPHRRRGHGRGGGC
jgi:hypothetical protein